jgi:hypothetical protein
MKLSHPLMTRATELARIAMNRAPVAAFTLALAANQAFAQVGGGTGTGDEVQARTTAVLTTGQAILFGVGGLILSGAVLYAAYGIGWGGKKWSELANVCGASAAGGMCVMLIGWLFA